MSKIPILSTLIALSLIFNSCSKENENNEEANDMLSTNEFVLTGLDKTQYVIKKQNKGFIVKDAKNKVVILDIFATWCPPCRAEASHLASLQKKYKDSLLIIGITVETDIKNSKLENFRNENDVNYILVNSDENEYLIDAIASELKVGRDFGIPLMAMYKDGKLINFYQGVTEEEFIESDIKRALGE